MGVETGRPPVDAWGGVGYSLAALSASLPAAWSVRPIMKLGSDLADEGRSFLGSIPRVDAEAALIVPEENNRVELSYDSGSERVERLRGGVPPWTSAELAPRLEGCDALYVNFISGFEMDLATAGTIRALHQGQTYADLHSLFLGVDADGRRIPRTLDAWEAWFGCFDAVQMNEHEFARLGADGEGSASAARLLGPDLHLIAVTHGDRGATCHTFEPASGRVADGSVTLTAERKSGDPTGCGDVWGGAMFGRLLAGDDVPRAMSEANRLAGLKLGYSGAQGLFSHFQERAAGAEEHRSEVTN